MKFGPRAQLRKLGFTLAEILIAVSLIMLLLFVIFVSWRRQIDRGNDLRRKSDLAAIKRAFEEYYNDKGCYPPVTLMDEANDCGSANLQPYLAAVPCDPVTKEPYVYLPLDQCKGYRLLTKLGDTGDLDIVRAGCSGVTGCGFGPDSNYGISIGGSVALPGFDPGATPTPTTPGGGVGQGGGYGCFGGVCNSAGPGTCQAGDTFTDSHCCVTEECKSCTTAACWDAKNACNDPATIQCQ